MKNLISQSLQKFLKAKFTPGQPLLLGCSGGPDSKALLYLLLECGLFPTAIHVAHIDHSWREESGIEAKSLEEECRALGVNWHLQTLSKADFHSGDLENQGRVQRLRFFKELYLQCGCQALLLGHQAEDQAEVVLKRVFEGAHLYSLAGLSIDSTFDSMRLWRPLLQISKKELIAWLERRGISYFTDPTNESEQFLRGRMRQEMLPFLTRSFGKEISGNLCFLGEEARMIKDYFSIVNAPLLQKATGAQLDFSDCLPLHPLQLTYLVRDWLQQNGATVSRSIIAGVVETLLCGKGEKVYKTGRVRLLVSNKTVIFESILE